MSPTPWLGLTAGWHRHDAGPLRRRHGHGRPAGAAALSRRLTFGAMVAIGPFAGLCASAAMLLTLWLPTGVLAGLGSFLFGAGPVLWTISTTTLRQVVTPAALLGRVSALVMTATFGARPVGAAIGAWVAGRFGVEACLAVSAAGFMVQVLVISASPVPRLRHLPEAAGQVGLGTPPARPRQLMHLSQSPDL